MTNNSLTQTIYYPAIGVSDQNWGLTVTTTGYQSVPANCSYPAGDHPPGYAFRIRSGRVLNEYQLIYISKGKGIFSSASIEETELDEGSLFMLFPGEWHTYRPENVSGWNTYWIGFRGATIDQMVASGFLSVKSPFIQMGYQEKLIGLFQEVLTFAREERPGCQQLLAGYVSYLLGQIEYRKRNEAITNDRIHLLIDKARMLMKEQVTQNISPEMIAGQLNVSYSWFRRFFRKYTGMAPGQYLTHLRMQQARGLLEQTTMPVQTIAELLHFESAGYFSVYFKRRTGLSPMEFRKSKKQRSTDR